jgi:uncharacterized protein YbjT (DUF2867 family)
VFHVKVVVVGGTGRIGSQVVEKLNAHGHQASPAAPQTGCNTVTNEGVEEALAGADVLVDVSNSPSFADEDVMDFFTTSTTNLLAAAKKAGIGHVVALSVVGADRLPASGYLRAKVAQEELIAASGLPFTIVRATQFFEFTQAIADSATVDGKVHLPPVLYQPIAAGDVSGAVGRAAVGTPTNGIHEIGGPEQIRMDQFVGGALAVAGDSREIVTDEHATYFGSELDDTSLVAGPDAEIGTTSYEAWTSTQSR